MTTISDEITVIENIYTFLINKYLFEETNLKDFHIHSSFYFNKDWIGDTLNTNTIYIDKKGLSFNTENWGSNITLEKLYIFDDDCCIGIHSGDKSLNTLSFLKNNQRSTYIPTNISGKKGDIYFPICENTGNGGYISGNKANCYALISKNSDCYIIKLLFTNPIIFSNLESQYFSTGLMLPSLKIKNNI